ncbi:hypothetical protein B0T17DRAFT_487771 [Bombardia bombarda]|uniref:Gpi-anchored protein n=1 Tax=Bombardia bombarda TaxID=252184 RepID=A0AA39X6D7_9PEZI|nr:hypothetical protein B0T17DRAFT_487771 [Bombardia bombarda]
MRNQQGRATDWHILLLLILAFATSVCAIQQRQPFQPVETAKPIAKRQSSQGQGCIANFFSCADQGAVFNGVCCQTGQRCALDASNSPACCPTNAVCTGTAPASFVTPMPTTAPVSFVPNAYFSFPYIATYFVDAGACSQAVSECSANYGACTSQLDGQLGSGPYGVTIVVPGGGGTTVTGGAQVNYGTASASSICSSLSSVACSGLQPSMCTMTGTTAGGFYFGTGTGNAAARPTAACGRGLVGAVAAGVAGFAVANAF